MIAALVSDDCSITGGSSVLIARHVAESRKNVGRLVESMETALMASAYDF